MLLTEIDHVAIAVKDLDAAIDYYARAFGAEVHHREIVDSDGVEEALVKVADSYIQLTGATRDDSPIAKFLEKRGEGLHHIGYRVDDCAAALAAMVIQQGKLFPPAAATTSETPFDGPVEQVVISGLGHWRGEGLALIERVE